MIMMKKVRCALHGRAKEHRLDLHNVIGAACMESTWVWKFLWNSFENEVNKTKMLGMNFSIATLKGHSTRFDAIKSINWERGSVFMNSKAQTFAKQSVLSEIEKRCDKKLRRAESIISAIVSDLCLIGLDECAVLSPDTKNDVCLVMAMVENAKHAIKAIQENAFNLRSAKLLTGFCAIMIPMAKNKEQDDATVSISLRHFCKLFGLGRGSKYIQLAINNRKDFNCYLETVGPLQVSEKVSCAGSDDGTIISMGMMAQLPSSSVLMKQ